MPRAVQASGRIWAIARDGSLRHADVSTTSEWTDAPSLPSPVVTLAACDDRVSVFAACRDGSLHLFHAHEASLLLSSPTPLHNVPLCMLPLPIENALFVGLQDGAVVRCHLTSLAFDCMLGCGVEHKQAVNALDADDLYLYSGGEDAVVLVWDLKDATAVREISIPSAAVRSLLRIDYALWTGLANGSVQAFDIFGDDSNGIERIVDKTPHAGPVTDLVKIGDEEIWSIAGVSDITEIPLDQAPSLAVWDTRDLSFAITDSLKERDLMSVSIVDRMAFEEVTVLALTSSLDSQFVSKTVRGSSDTASPDECSGNCQDIVSELEDQLAQASEELQIIRSSPSYQKALEEEQKATMVSSLFIPPQQLGPHPHDSTCGDVAEVETVSLLHRNRSFDCSPTSIETEEDPFALPKSTSETLQTSLSRISELLVTLLTNDVLSPEDGYTRESSEELRASVATITRELNIGRQLVESCAAAKNKDRPLHTLSENDPSRNIDNQKSCCESAISTFRKKLDKQRANKEKLERDLKLVTGERDLLEEELATQKAQTETTMTSLQSALRDENTRVTEKDALIEGLRHECKMLESKFTKEFTDREQRYEETIEELHNQAKNAAGECEDQMHAVYDKLEMRDIEIQTQKDSIHALESKRDSLLAAEKSLREECESLRGEISQLKLKTQDSEDGWHARSAQAANMHRKILSALGEEHASKLRDARSKHERVVDAMEMRINQYENERQEQLLHLQRLRNELEAEKQNLDSANVRVETLEALHDQKTSEVTSQASRDMERLRNEVAVLEQRLNDSKQQAETELKISTEKFLCQIQEKDAKIDSLRSGIASLQEGTESGFASPDQRDGVVRLLTIEISSLQEELQHRKSAADLYEQECQAVNLAASKFRAAANELQTALDTADKENADLREKLEELRALVAGKETYIEELEEQRKRENRWLAMDVTSASDGNSATQALLASANGEIEQMSNQLEAMHIAHTQQERELSELRVALASVQQGNIANFGSSSGLLPSTNNRETEQENTNNASVPIPSLPQVAIYTPHGSPVDESLISDALREVQAGMEETQGKLRDLSSTARKYRKCAQSHLDVLPVLYELEAELLRVSQEGPKTAGRLKSSRGIVQSVIALYYSSSEKRSVLSDFDENLYIPSTQRLEALQRTIAEMRALRTGSQKASNALSVDSVPPLRENRTFPDEHHRDDVPTPRRLLTY